jgi:hypothetical protein
MTMGHVNGTVIDADGHVLEPRGTCGACGFE